MFCVYMQQHLFEICCKSLILFFVWVAALTKSVGLRTDARIDERSYWLTRAASLSASLAIPLVYPRMFSVHNLPSKVLFVLLICLLSGIDNYFHISKYISC